jgi:hypothetical protein
MLMTVGHYHGYPTLPLKPGVSIAEGYAVWRTFIRDSREQWLDLAADAMRATWPDDPMIHDLVYVEPEPPADDVATGTRPDQENAPMSTTDGLDELRAVPRETDALNDRTAAAYVPNSEDDDTGDDENCSLEKLLAGCCTPGKPCGDHFDDVFEAWRDEQTDRHLEGA